VNVTAPGNDLVGQLLGLGVKSSGSGHRWFPSLCS
jgi:hypothetical protein